MSVVWRYWEGDKPPTFDWIRSTVRSMNKSVEIRDPLSALKTLGSYNEIERLASLLDDPRHRSNVYRAFVLLNFGGLWLDCDIIPLVDLTMISRPFISAHKGKVEGSVMSFGPSDPDIMNLCSQIAVESKRNDNPVDASGARVLQMAIKRAKKIDVFSHDARGDRAAERPLVVHLWETSSKRLS